jgi:hypothetical protein
VPIIAAIIKLRNVLPHVLCADVNVSAEHRTLEVTPVAFDGVGVMNSGLPLFLAMVHAAKSELVSEICTGR